MPISPLVNAVFGVVVVLAPQMICAQEPVISQAPANSGEGYRLPPAIPAPPDEAAALDVASTPESLVTYTLEELLQLASANNPTLRQAQLQISAELAKALQAGLYPNPTFMYQGEQIFLDIEGNKDSPGEFQGGILEQRFVTAGKLRLSREKYLRRASIAEHQAMAQQFRVCNDVRIHFYRALAGRKSLEIRRELLKTAEDGAVTAQESYNLGQARRSQVRQANVALQRARLEVLSAENMYNEERRRLLALVGAPPSGVELVGELAPQQSPLSFPEALGRVLSESPELAAARAKLSVDRMTVRREEVEWVPDIVVRGGTGYNFEAKETTAVAGISLEVPIYDRNQGTIRQARADYSRQREEIERVELDLRSRLAMTYQQYATALQHAHEYERVILPELKAAYAELLESYKEDRIDWPEVLFAQRDYFDARLSQVDNLRVARTQEVLVYGYLLHGGLIAAPNVTPPGHIDAVPKPR